MILLSTIYEVLYSSNSVNESNYSTQSFIMEKTVDCILETLNVNTADIGNDPLATLTCKVCLFESSVCNELQLKRKICEHRQKFLDSISQNNPDCNFMAANYLSCIYALIYSMLFLEPKVNFQSNTLVKLQKVLEFFVGFGVIPCLNPGVGVAMRKRVRSVDSLVALHPNNLTDLERKLRQNILELCVLSLFDLWRNENFRPLISNKFLNDLLAGLMQLSHANADDEGCLFKQCLSEICFEVYQPLLIRELLLLQTGFGPTHRPPIWLRSHCGALLTECLLKPGGLAVTLRAVSDFGGSVALNDEWKRCESIAAIVAACPRALQSSPELYYKNICQQLLDLVIVQPAGDRLPTTSQCSGVDLSCLYVFACCTRQIWARNASICKTYLLDPLLLPFDVFQLSSEDGNAAPESVDLGVFHRGLHSRLLALHAFVCRVPSDDSYALAVCNYTDLFYSMLLQLNGTTSNATILLKELLSCYLTSVDVDLSCTVCQSWISSHQFDQYRFTPGPDNFLLASLASSNLMHTIDQREIDQRITVLFGLIDLLNCEKQSSIVAALIKQCLLHLNDCLAVENDKKTSSRSNCIIEAKDTSVYRWRLIETVLLECLLERYSAVLVHHGSVLFSVCEAVLKDSNVSEQAVMSVLGILSLFLLDADTFDDSVASELQPLILLLETLSSAPLSLKWCSSVRSNVDCFLHAVIARTNQGNLSAAPNHQNFRHNSATIKNFASAMRFVDDVFVPIKGHGLICLADLIKIRDKETLSNADLILSTLLDCLSHDDSYVYLSAVKCLSMLGEICPNVVLEFLLSKFAADANTSENQVVRLKIGEVLMKIAKNFGELAPVYAKRLVDNFISLFLKSADDSFIRASCLSNLAEICRLMSFKLADCLHELFYCVKQTLELATSDIERRAAAYLLRMMLESCRNSDTLLAMFQDLILGIYRLLKHLATADRDWSVRLHSELSLRWIDGHMSTFFNPKIQEIRIS